MSDSEDELGADEINVDHTPIVTHDDEDEEDLFDQHQSHIKSHAQPNYYNNDGVEGSGFFNDHLYRQLTWSGLLLFFSMLAIGRMYKGIDAPHCTEEFNTDRIEVSNGFILSSIGLSLILLLSLIELIIALMRKDSLGFVLFIGLLLASLIYLIGTFIIIAEINNVLCISGASDSETGGYSMSWFGESFLISSITVLFAVDLWKKTLFNDFRLRMLLHLGCLTFSSLFAFFGYAVLANYFLGLNSNVFSATASDLAYTASGWFFIMISCGIYLLILLKVQKETAYLICSIILIMASILCGIGYWALNIIREDAYNAYLVGMSFFLIGISVVYAIDMSLGKWIKKLMRRR